eukprot:6864686-Prymnesium_polylepis.1
MPAGRLLVFVVRVPRQMHEVETTRKRNSSFRSFCILFFRLLSFLRTYVLRDGEREPRQDTRLRFSDVTYILVIRLHVR